MKISFVLVPTEQLKSRHTITTMRSIIPAAVITSIGFLAQVIAFPLERQNLAKCDPGVEPPLWLPAPEAGLKKKDADPSFQAQDRENQVIEVRGVSNM